MNPKPLRRSIIFWSGILVMGFICWAWWASTRRGDGARAGTWRLHHWASGLAILHEPGVKQRPGLFREELEFLLHNYRDLPPGEIRDESEWLGKMRLARPGFYRHGLAGEATTTDHLARLSGPMVDPALCCAAVDSAFRTSVMIGGWPPVKDAGWVLFLPHWLVLLAVALPWSGLLLWRARRVRRR